MIITSGVGGVLALTRGVWMGVAAATAVAVSSCETAKIDPETANVAAQLPIADLHLHPERNLSANTVRDRMDRNGVRWAGAGVKGGG